MTGTLRSVPTAPGRVPVLGHLGSLLTRPLRFVRSLREHGDVVRIYFGNRPVYAVTSPEVLHELLTVHGSDFDKGSIFEEGKAFVGEGLLTSAGDLHRQQRRLIQPAFHDARIEHYVPAMRDAALRISAQWRPGQPIDLNRAMMKVAFDAITAVMFSGTMDPDAGDRLLGSLPLLIRGALVRAISPGFVRRLPIAMNSSYPRTVATVHGIIDRLLAQCAAAPDRHPDLVHMLQTAGGSSAEPGMDQRQLFDELVSIMIAGTETTGGAMAWVCYEMAHRPEIGDRVRDEVDRVVGTRAVTAADLANLEYTQRVMCEVLRQRAVWLSSRRALRPVELGGFAVPAGTELVFSLYALHHDPEIYPRPDEFDVDRWLPGVTQTRPRSSFIPFLEGSRKCLGHTFAWREMATVVATLAARWRLYPSPGLRVREVPLATIRPSRLIMLPVPRTRESWRHDGEQEVRL